MRTAARIEPAAEPAAVEEQYSGKMGTTASTQHGGETVRILHISDTHSMHRQIEPTFGQLPDADILVHTGDFTNSGRMAEFEDFNGWLGELRQRGSFGEIVVITGNHEWRLVKSPDGSSDAVALTDLASRADYADGLRQLLSNATVLEHEMVEVCGVKLFGSAWCPWQTPGDPDRVVRHEGTEMAIARWQEAGHADPFEEIPEGVDVLLTHGPAFGIFDEMEGSQSHWGGSEVVCTMRCPSYKLIAGGQALRERIKRMRPTVHCFGHLHEQRGVWYRDQLESGEYQGGVEYWRGLGDRLGRELAGIGKGLAPPPAEYPCQVISCNAMKNHPGLEGLSGCIAGPGRLLVAKRPDPAARWTFQLGCNDSVH